MTKAWPAWLILGLAVPFHPFWPDYETARRGLLLVGAALVALVAGRRMTARPDAVEAALLALGGWHLVRSVGVINPMAGVDRALLWLALWAIYKAGRTTAIDAWQRAAIAAALVVGGFGLLQGVGATGALHGVLWDLDPDPAGWSPVWMALQSVLDFALGEPVSTLGNRNVASEFVALAGAGSAVALARAPRARLAWTATAVAVAFLVVNQSRSGLLALPLAAACILAQRGIGPRGRLRVVAAALAGLGAGLLGHLGRGSDAAPITAVAPAAQPSTVEIRLRLWRSCAEMAWQSPWGGVGSGQFAAHYPRFRDPREIELSSFDRRFEASPKTAHNDHLEVLVETGVLGAALWLLLWLAALRAALRHGAAGLALLVAFLALTLVRSPLGNAPAAALLFGSLGALAGPGRAPGPALAMLPIAAGALLTGWLGGRAVAAQTALAAIPRAARFTLADVSRLDAADRAIAWVDHDPASRSYRLQRTRIEARNAARPLSADEVDADLDALARIAPHDVAGLLSRARVAQALGQPGRAMQLLQQLRALDPRHPQAAVLEAVLHMENGDAGAAIVALYRDPHPMLRAELARTFSDLTRAAEQRGRPADEVLAYRTEAAFVTAVDAAQAQGADSPDAIAAAHDLFELFEAHGVVDIRQLILSALALPTDDDRYRDMVQSLAARAHREGLRLTAPHRRILEGLEQPLLAIPEWRTLLEP